jgi:hypothetical protein
MMNIDELNRRELRDTVARDIMGWMLSVNDNSPPVWLDRDGRFSGYLAAEPEYERDYTYQGDQRVYVPQVFMMGTSIWEPDNDANAARLVEEEIRRRNLMHHYILELMAICAPNMLLGNAPTYGDLWNMVHASAADRCRAALRAVVEDK